MIDRKTLSIFNYNCRVEHRKSFFSEKLLTTWYARSAKYHTISAVMIIVLIDIRVRFHDVNKRRKNQTIQKLQSNTWPQKAIVKKRHFSLRFRRSRSADRVGVFGISNVTLLSDGIFPSKSGYMQLVLSAVFSFLSVPSFCSWASMRQYFSQLLSLSFLLCIRYIAVLLSSDSILGSREEL